MDFIEVRGARTHNLKNLQLTIPRDKLIVITASQVPENPRWRSTRSTQKGNVATSNHFQRMHDSFYR